MVKVKICANKSIEDAKICLEANADIIGILVGQEHNSVDFIVNDYEMFKSNITNPVIKKI